MPVATERITNPIGGRVESPKVDYKPGGAITLATKRQGEHQGEGLSHLLITPSLRSWSINFFADFSIPAGGLGQVVLLTGLAPGLTLILIGATLAKEEGSPKESENARG